MQHYEDWFEYALRPRIYHQWWLPDGEATAVVLIVHGFTEHSGRYTTVAEELVEQGYAVHALDLPGHGKSSGERVFIENFYDLVIDVLMLATQIGQTHRKRPLFLFGHSMGGAIVSLLAGSLGDRATSNPVDKQAHPALTATGPRADVSDVAGPDVAGPDVAGPDVAGIVLSAPAIRVGQNVFPLLRRLASFFGRIAPRLRLVKLGNGMLSRDPAVVADFESDPLVFRGRFPVRTGAELLAAMHQVETGAASVELPMLVLQGTGDKVVDPKGARKFHFHASSKDKTLRIYEGLYHDLLHEPEHKEVLADMIAWLNGQRDSR